MGALGCFRKLLGRLWATKWPLESAIWAREGHFGDSWVALGCFWGALGATLGTKKATKEAPRRVTEPFGDPTGLWKSPGVILEVVLGSKKTF